MREVVLDTETTGLSYKAGDRITEVGCTELINHVPTGKKLQFYCSVEKKVSEDAVRISGLTNEFLNQHQPFEDNLENLLNFIKKDTLIIHNADFDIGFINNELSLLRKPPLKNKIIDTVKLARKTLNTRVANLDYLCRRFSIDLSERGLHGALLDTQLLAEVYLELIGGKQISMNLGALTIGKNISKININKSKLIFTKIKLTNDDTLQHKNLLKQIKDPIWDKIDY